MKFSGNRGFTLIEIMIVVAIIGILSSLATPMVLKYQAQAKRAEAKLNLSAVFTGEMTFYSEYSYFTSYLDFVGWSPSGKTYYRVGFTGAYPTTAIPGIPLFSGDLSKVSTDASTAKECTDANLGSSTSPTVSRDAFTVGACGDVSNNPTNDGWTIDNRKSLTNVQNGI